MTKSIYLVKSMYSLVKDAMNKIVTIGAYGFNRESFFQNLVDAKIDTFCDIRRRRGVRGPEYAFANSQYLQKKLQELGIHYVYIQDLAPSQAMREKQKQEDEKFHIAKRSRKVLGQTFVSEYIDNCLSRFEPSIFLEKVGPNAQVVCLFCVERVPEACHRSLVSSWLTQTFHLPVEHIVPPIV